MQRPAAYLTLVLALALVASVSGAAETAGAAPHGPGTRARDSFEAYRRFLAAGGAGEDPTLFTAGSRVYLARAPRPSGAEATRLAELDAAAPLRLRVAGERAALVPHAHGTAVRPVLLERVEETWRIDLVETEKAFEPDEKGGLRLRYGSPYKSVLPYPGGLFPGELEPVDLFGEDPASAITRLERAHSAASLFRRAEILLRNCWLVDEALPLYEEAIRTAPEPYPFARSFGLRALLVGQPDRAIPFLEPFEPRTDQLLGRLHARAKRFEISQKYMRRSVAQRLERFFEKTPDFEVGPGFQKI